jgi:hypothetical protein
MRVLCRSGAHVCVGAVVVVIYHWWCWRSQIVYYGGGGSHTMTLGLQDTVDYFVSGDAVSPPSLQASMNEQVVRLGDIGIFLCRPSAVQEKERHQVRHCRCPAPCSPSCVQTRRSCSMCVTACAVRVWWRRCGRWCRVCRCSARATCTSSHARSWPSTPRSTRSSWAY